MIEIDTLIIGAGLCGLSCGYHLRKAGRKDFLILESNPYPGGLSSSIHQDGFVFDWSGHLLHLHSPEGKKLVRSLLRGNLLKINRSAWIHLYGAQTRYPFQANTYGLPPSVVSECVTGFLKAYQADKTPVHTGPFDKWASALFGDGICKHFMYPYNRKLWQYPLDKMTALWCGAFVPRPKPEEVIKGAYFDQGKAFGYNASFLYPEKGGIGALASALAEKTGNISYSTRVLSVDMAKKQAKVRGRNGAVETIRFKRLLNTAPLKEFILAATGCPPAVKTAAHKLKCAGIDILNLGVKGKVSDKHWLYFPEKKYPFYRAGIASNFSAHIAPRNTASLYIEIPHESLPVTQRAVVAGLRDAGILGKGNTVITAQRLAVPYAYVIYDKERNAAMKTIMAALKKRGCVSAGRYGGWKYSFMEEALADGRLAARELLSFH